MPFALVLLLPLVGCSAVATEQVEAEPENIETPFSRARSIVEGIRESSLDVLAAVPDDAPCRPEWRRLAADATEALRRLPAIERSYAAALMEQLARVSRNRFYRPPYDPSRRAAGELLDPIRAAREAVVGCVERGGLTPEEWVELEAAGRRAPDPDPVQQNAVERIGRPVA